MGFAGAVFIICHIVVHWAKNGPLFPSYTQEADSCRVRPGHGMLCQNKYKVLNPNHIISMYALNAMERILHTIKTNVLNLGLKSFKSF